MTENVLTIDDASRMTGIGVRKLRKILQDIGSVDRRGEALYWRAGVNGNTCSIRKASAD